MQGQAAVLRERQLVEAELVIRMFQRGPRGRILTEMPAVMALVVGHAHTRGQREAVGDRPAVGQGDRLAERAPAGDFFEDGANVPLAQGAPGLMRHGLLLFSRFVAMTGAASRTKSPLAPGGAGPFMANAHAGRSSFAQARVPHQSALPQVAEAHLLEGFQIARALAVQVDRACHDLVGVPVERIVEM